MDYSHIGSQYRSCKKNTSSIYLTIGTGIGGGVILNNKILEGFNHPEMGHITIRRHPKDKFIGSCPYHSDCLEGLACGKAIEDRWGKKAYELGMDHELWWSDETRATFIFNKS